MDCLTTDRLLLRPFEPDDVDELAALHAEPSFWRYPLGRGQTRVETETFVARVLGKYTADGFCFHAVVPRAGGTLAGWAGLSVPSFLPEVLPAVEVGWRLGSAFRGRGYATEAGAACVRWGFESLGLDRIVSIYEPAHEASGRVMIKLGFELDRVVVDPTFGVAMRVTALTRDSWARLVRAGEWPWGPPDLPESHGRCGTQLPQQAQPGGRHSVHLRRKHSFRRSAKGGDEGT